MMNSGWLKYIWKAHLANPLWADSLTRRKNRQQAWADYKMAMFRKFIPFIESLQPDTLPLDNNPGDNQTVFTIWMQGEYHAPSIVHKCLDSMHRHFKSNLRILNSENISEYISLPEFIHKKRKENKIGDAHFTDICRMELLHRYGGYWLDATCFVTGEIPKLIKESDFFMYISSDRFYTHMFVQNCFIRSKKNEPLLNMWLKAVYHYWEIEDKPLDYYIVQNLFRLLVSYNSYAADLFQKMPKLEMDPTHVLWHSIGNMPFERSRYDQMKKEAFFQKCSYKKQKKNRGVNDILPGSFADYIINGKTEE